MKTLHNDLLWYSTKHTYTNTTTSWSLVIDWTLSTLSLSLWDWYINHLKNPIRTIHKGYNGTWHTVVKILPNNSLNNTGENVVENIKRTKNRKTKGGCDRSMVSQEWRGSLCCWRQSFNPYLSFHETFLSYTNSTASLIHSSIRSLRGGRQIKNKINIKKTKIKIK